jgi:hypothetical protein
MPAARLARAVLACALLLGPALAGCLADGGEAGPSTPVEAAREAAAWLEDPQRALAAGYQPAPACAPGEGVHWVNEDRVDTEIVPSEPEVLLFAPTTANATDPDRQRLVGVEYVAVTQGTDRNDSANPPEVLGEPMEGPVPGARGEPWHATLHVFLDGRQDPHAREAARVPCPDGTTPPGVAAPPSPPRDDRGLVDAPRLPACDTLTGERTHEHAHLIVDLPDRGIVDLSPDRYQLAAGAIHVEGGDRDAEGALVHVHQARPSLACFLATLGWHAEDGLLALDTGEVYRDDATHRLSVLVDGEPAPEGVHTPLRGDTRYQLTVEDLTRGASV